MKGFKERTFTNPDELFESMLKLRPGLQRLSPGVPDENWYTLQKSVDLGASVLGNVRTSGYTFSGSAQNFYVAVATKGRFSVKKGQQEIEFLANAACIHNNLLDEVSCAEYEGISFSCDFSYLIQVAERAKLPFSSTFLDKQINKLDEVKVRSFAQYAKFQSKLLELGTSEFYLSEFYKTNISEGLAFLILGAISPVEQFCQSKNSDIYISRAIEFIETNLSSEFSVMDVSAAAGCGTRYLQVLFKKKFGFGVKQYELKNRLANARNLLLNSSPGTSVLGVAVDCGFRYLQGFSNYYFSEYGEKPSQTLRRRGS